jgi:protein-disulfide isomerase
MLAQSKGIIAIVLFCVGLLVGLSFLGGERNKTTSNTLPLDKNLLQVKSDDWVKGNPDASITLIEYLDFECEACRAYYPFVKQVSEEFKNDLRVVVRYFPLPGHKNGLPAALAVESAGRQGKFWEMYDIVFENQAQWGEKQTTDSKIFEEYAQKIGLDLDKFRQDVNSQSVKDRIQRDVDSGIKLGNTGTPSFFLNGQKVQNLRSYEEFKNLIQAEILKANESQTNSLEE